MHRSAAEIAYSAAARQYLPLGENEKHLINNIKIQSRHLTKYSDEILVKAIKDRVKGLSIKEIRKKYNLGKQIENILYKKSRVYLWDKINNN